jgi:hypothetical protein
MIYIAAPYYSPYPVVIEARMQKVYAYAAKLMQNGQHCISPMFFHPVVKLHELPNDFAFWGDLSIDLLKRCDSLHVLCLGGWRESKGVSEELRYCLTNNKPVVYVEL